MGYDFCLRCLKYTVLSVNFLFWLFGLGVLGVGIWLRFDPHTTSVVGAGENLERYYTSIYILIGVGALMTLVGFVGCCGAFQESQCLLSMFFLFVLVIFGAEIGGATWAYTHKLELKTFIEQSLRDSVQREYGRNKAKTIAFDFIQSKIMCCGGESPYDWNYSFYVTGKETPEIGVVGEILNKFPPSCCIPEAYDRFGDYCGNSNFTKIVLNEKSSTAASSATTSKTVSDDNTIDNRLGPLVGNLLDSDDASQNSDTNDVSREKLYGNGMIWQRGCSQAIEDYFRSNLDIIIGIGLAIIILQLLVLLLSIILCCYIGRADLDMDEYK